MSVLPVDQAMASRVRGAPFGTGCWSGGHDHGHSLERDAHVDLDKLGHDHGHSLGREALQECASEEGGCAPVESPASVQCAAWQGHRPSSFSSSSTVEWWAGGKGWSRHSQLHLQELLYLEKDMDALEDMHPQGGHVRLLYLQLRPVNKLQSARRCCALMKDSVNTCGSPPFNAFELWTAVFLLSKKLTFIVLFKKQTLLIDMLKDLAIGEWGGRVFIVGVDEQGGRRWEEGAVRPEPWRG